MTDEQPLTEHARVWSSDVITALAVLRADLYARSDAECVSLIEEAADRVEATVVRMRAYADRLRGAAYPEPEPREARSTLPPSQGADFHPH